MMISKKWTWVLAGLIVTPIVAHADEAIDKRFIKEAGEACAAEDQISRLPADRAHNSDVKHFADESLKGQKELLEDLRHIAERHDYHIPDHMSDKQHDKYEDLKKLRGDDFDIQYMSNEKQDQADLVDLFKKAHDSCEDKNLREFAERKMDYLKRQRDDAEHLYDRLKKHDR